MMVALGRALLTCYNTTISAVHCSIVVVFDHLIFLVIVIIRMLLRLVYLVGLRIGVKGTDFVLLNSLENRVRLQIILPRSERLSFNDIVVITSPTSIASVVLGVGLFEIGLVRQKIIATLESLGDQRNCSSVDHVKPDTSDFCDCLQESGTALAGGWVMLICTCLASPMSARARSLRLRARKVIEASGIDFTEARMVVQYQVASWHSA